MLGVCSATRGYFADITLLANVLLALHFSPFHNYCWGTFLVHLWCPNKCCLYCISEWITHYKTNYQVWVRDAGEKNISRSVQNNTGWFSKNTPHSSVFESARWGDLNLVHVGPRSFSLNIPDPPLRWEEETHQIIAVQLSPQSRRRRRYERENFYSMMVYVLFFFLHLNVQRFFFCARLINEHRQVHCVESALSWNTPVEVGNLVGPTSGDRWKVTD